MNINLLSVTENAAKQIKKIILDSKEKCLGVRVDVDKTGCSGYAYKIDYATTGDFKNYELIETKGIKVYIQPTATMFLIGSEMDYSKDKLASRFIFNNPNEKSTCGCGESFNI